jgi:putative aldouronate transport system permease protein
MNIPMAIIESAKIDGAGEFTTFIKIIMPLSLPIMATVGLLVGVSYWNDWNNGLIYITKPQFYSIQNLLNRILQDIQFLATNPDMNAQSGEVMTKLPSTTVRMAIAVIGVLPILVIYPFFQKYFQKGMTIGAVKG